MKHIITKTWNGSDMDIYNTSSVIECDQETFKKIALDTMKNMGASKIKAIGSSKYEYDCEDQYQYVEDSGSIRMRPYNGEYAVKIIANTNTVSYLTKEKYDKIIKRFKAELSEDDFEESERQVYADDGENFYFIIKL